MVMNRINDVIITMIGFEYLDLYLKESRIVSINDRNINDKKNMSIIKDY